MAPKKDVTSCENTALRKSFPERPVTLFANSFGSGFVSQEEHESNETVIS